MYWDDHAISDSSVLRTKNDTLCQSCAAGNLTTGFASMSCEKSLEDRYKYEIHNSLTKQCQLV